MAYERSTRGTMFDEIQVRTCVEINAASTPSHAPSTRRRGCEGRVDGVEGRHRGPGFGSNLDTISERCPRPHESRGITTRTQGDQELTFDFLTGRLVGEGRVRRVGESAREPPRNFTILPAVRAERGGVRRRLRAHDRATLTEIALRRARRPPAREAYYRAHKAGGRFPRRAGHLRGDQRRTRGEGAVPGAHGPRRGVS